MKLEREGSDAKGRGGKGREEERGKEGQREGDEFISSILLFEPWQLCNMHVGSYLKIRNSHKLI